MRDLRGSRLGQYELHEIIGRGGTATVYKAYQPSLNRLVAVKILDGFNDPQLVARFRREAESIAQLQHRNILPIYDFGDENGLLYFVVQYVEGGRTLNDLFGDEIDPARAITLVRHLLAGLAYAHARGIVHRDVKPSNVLLPEPDWPLLADFGVAKLLADRATRLTGDGVAVGTLAYMSPEQALNQRIDARSDIYAIGVILYELFTGRVPFEATTPPVVLLQHINTPPMPPSRLNPAIPPAVEAVVMRALEKDPDRRYQDAESMRQALARLQASAAAKSPPTVPILTVPVSVSPWNVQGDRSAQADAGSPGPHPGGKRQRTPVPAGAGNPPPPGAPQPPPGWGAIPPPPHGHDRRRRVGIIASIASLALVTGLLSIFLLRDRAGDPQGEIVLEAVASQGEHPFTPNVAVPRPRSPVVAAPPAARVLPTPQGGQLVTGQSGSMPGLYGGSQENAPCDVEQLALFLTTHLDRGRAWVSALNSDPMLEWSGGKRIQVDQIPQYLRELTPLVLRHDVRVTNHGFDDGLPTPRQSVLQAGTAVLVDRFGVPRVRCACGNPLTRMQPTATTPVYQGPKWVTFDPGQVVAIQPARTVINEFVIVNMTTGHQEQHDPGPKPVPCDDVNQDGTCDPRCSDEDHDGFCDQPCKDTGTDGNCDQTCPDGNDNGLCDDAESACPNADANRNGVCDDAESACPNGDADRDALCDLPASLLSDSGGQGPVAVSPSDPAPTDDASPQACPSPEEDGVCDGADPDADDPAVACPSGDPACGPAPDQPTCAADANADGVCDDLDADPTPACTEGDAASDGVCDEADPEAGETSSPIT